jgi:hypothetical protein
LGRSKSPAKGLKLNEYDINIMIYDSLRVISDQKTFFR